VFQHAILTLHQMEPLPSPEQLEAQARRLVTEPAIAIPSDTVILNSIPLEHPAAPEQTVRLSQVSTYVYTHDLGKTIGNQRIIFPSFASHWAVLVTDSGYEQDYPRVYHLTFKDAAAARSKPPAQTSREIVFMTETLKTVPPEAKAVGKTRYNHAQLMKIGEALIEAFGSYHRVFWNCQHFARLYLHAITNGEGKFEEWTLGQTTQLFLCAFIITTPITTTSKAIETQKARQILEQFPDTLDVAIDDVTVVNASDEAITLAQSLALLDYEQNHPSDVRVERVGTLKSILDALAGLAERVTGRKRRD
jgi:hypothetical protein